MATTNAASRKRGAAARSEVNGRPKTITVRRVKLTLAPTVKFRLLKDMIAVRDTDGDMEKIVAGLERILGDQMEKVWDIDVKPGKGGLQLALLELLNEVTDKVFTAYGVTPGE